jgi:hypothetical protein
MKTKAKLDKEFADLEVTCVRFDDGKKCINIKHVPYITMIDGKALQEMYGNKSMASCAICQCKPKEMSDLNNIDSIKFHPKSHSILHGISPLHTMLQTFRFFINIGCRVTFNPKTWKVSPSYKLIFERRKKEIQDQFLSELGLIVDKMLSGGGISTTGNVCRRAFQNIETTARILKIDVEIAKRFKNIFFVIKSKYKINSISFQSYCSTTYKMILEKYRFVLMPPSVHKVLAHTIQVADRLPLPLSYFGEEGSEGRNKNYRDDRRNHASRYSRTSCMRDVFNRSMDSSDPLISITTGSYETKIPSSLPQEIKNLIIFDDVDNDNKVDELHSAFDEVEESENEDIDLSEDENDENDDST